MQFFELQNKNKDTEILFKSLFVQKNSEIETLIFK